MNIVVLGLLKMAPLGLKLLKTGRMVFSKDHIKHPGDIQTMLDRVKES